MESIPSIRELRALCQATAPNPARESYVGLFSRRFSIYVTRALIPTRITPNQITVLSVLVFFLGTAFFIKPDLSYQLIGCALIFFSIILDGCDGEIARYKKNGSIAGTLYVEPVSHDVQYGLMFPLLGFFLYLQGYHFAYIAIGFAASLAKLLFRLLEIRFWGLQHASVISADELEKLKAAYGQKPLLVRMFYFVNKNFFSSTGVFTLIFIATLLRHIDWYLIIFALAYTGTWLLLFVKQMYMIAHKRY